MAATKGTQKTAKAAKATKATKARKSLDAMIDANPTTATGYQAYYRRCIKAGKVLDY